MAKGTFRFYEELNDYLPDWQKKVDIETEFIGKRCIKETIEDFGVPPSTVDLVLVNGKPVDFQYALKHGDRMSVYPVFEKLNIQNVSMLRKSPLRRVRFIVDVDLQDTARLTRMLGFDTVFNPTYRISDIIEVSRQEKRIVLTMRKELLKSKSATRVVQVSSGTTIDQVKGVMDDLDIKDRVKPFSRCLRCNTRLEDRQIKESLHRILPETKRIFEQYLLCRSCRKDDRQKNTWQLKVGIIRL
jgi:uncharacterized protein with PIN domain